jgi:branched-chain amino acid transport system substrate-binding protein
MRLHRVAALATSVLLPLSATACTMSVGTSGDTSPIVIAADLELSGAGASLGNTYQRALQLEIDRINTQGGVNGRPLRLDTRDNRTDPSASVANVTAFVADPAVAAIVMGSCSPCAMSVVKTVNDKHVPTISLSPSSEVVRPVADRPYVFKLGPNADDSAAALVDELKLARVHTVAIASTDDADGSEAVGAMTAQAPKANATIVNRALFKTTDTDVSQPVRAALVDNPDALVVAAFPNQAMQVAKSAKDANFKGKIFFSSTAAGDLFLTGPSGQASDATVMVASETLVIDDVIATTPANAARKQWFNDYTSKYGGFSGYASYAADAVQLVTNAIRRVGGVNHSAMRDVIEDTQLDGLSGPIRITPDNHSGLMPQALTTLVVRSGRWRLLGG